MIPLTKLSRNQITGKLSPYRDKKVILWGYGEEIEKISQLLLYFSVDIHGFCDHNPENWGQVKEDKFVMSPELLLDFAEAEGFENVVVQLALPQKEEGKWANWCKEKGFSQLIATEEALEVLGYLHLSETAWKEVQLPHFPLLQKKNQLSEQIKAEQYLLTEEETPLFLCLPPKTGDHSLMNTFQKMGISHHFIFHQPQALPKCSDRPIKIITAVRDPITENISMFYQILGDLSHSMTAHYLLSVKEPDFFVENTENTDIQLLFDHFTESILNGDSFGAAPIQLFFQEFQHHVFDLLKHPFDKEKGFTVISTSEFEIFVYQLEKLNSLLPELSSFVGKEISSLETGNLTKNKWVGDSYALALENLTFSEDYFKFCYDADWVKHFYTSEDIEKMKQRYCGQMAKSFVYN